MVVFSPEEWTKWHYEVVLAFDDPGVRAVALCVRIVAVRRGICQL